MTLGAVDSGQASKSGTATTIIKLRMKSTRRRPEDQQHHLHVKVDVWMLLGNGLSRTRLPSCISHACSVSIIPLAQLADWAQEDLAGSATVR